ncbi:Protein CBG01214 [Caenorhabditis briggsae]|uniref:Protein CBG01214 n=1 Tax=Caenorhabditis briggsae TaxID=6238 RepID=A8WPV0_CAEBR|nr:Protein CBG01214 [Caenorhabditis briggsae]CAP22508.2 Protein CBG01214 [Caenorhabditis briggsae]
MKIKQPKTTTIAPYFNEFNFEDDHSVPSYENELQFLFDYEAIFEDFGKNTLAYYLFLGILDNVYKYATYFSFCVNLFHLFILTRKELRTNLVYIVMIGICLCDLVQLLANIFQYVLLWNIVYKIDQCYDGYKYSHVFVNLMAKTTQIMSRRCSSVLALYLGGIRTFSIIFPLCTRISSWIKPISGVWVILITIIICIAWSAIYAFQVKFEKILYCDVYDPKPRYIPYRMVEKENGIFLYLFIDGCMAMLISLCYVVLAIALVIAIRKAKKRSSSLNNEKSSTNTSGLIIMMAATVFIAEISYGSLYLLIYNIFLGHAEQHFLKNSNVFVQTLFIFNSATHFFICFFLSSQYRNTVRNLFWRREIAQNSLIPAGNSPFRASSGNPRNSERSY